MRWISDFVGGKCEEKNLHLSGVMFIAVTVLKLCADVEA